MAPVEQKIIDHGYEAIKKEILAYKETHVDIGLWGEGDSPKNNIAARAAVHEFGSQKAKIPKRPFMRQTHDKNRAEIDKKIEDGYSLIVAGKGTANKILKKIGSWYEGAMKKEIVDGDFTPLDARTIARKGSDTPLIDTGDMRRAITNKLFRKRAEVK